MKSASSISAPGPPPDQLSARATIVLPLPLQGTYDYAVPDQAAAKRGLVVRAPLGKRDVLGIVWGEARAEIPPERLRPAVPLVPNQFIPPGLCDFIDWVSRYTLSPLGAVAAQAMRVASAFDPEKPRRAYRLGPKVPSSKTTARTKILELMADGLARSAADIAEVCGVSQNVVRSLAGVGALHVVALPEFSPFSVPDPDFCAVTLSPDQAYAAARLRDSITSRAFSVHLLDGVTGSGKTETYFEVVAEALAQDAQVLILLPEIALTVQFLDRFAARFGCRPAEWHSGLGPRARRQVYRAVMSGEARVVVGARSALFLPFAALGLIVVDEEHEHAYKQEEGVIYHARDMAVVRARIENCPIVLSSATPSLETYLNARSDRYHWLKLSRRHGGAEMPTVRLVDLRKDGVPGKFISKPLAAALEETLEAGEQALLFLNRRGYAPLTLCAGCGHKLTCRDCSAWLVEHRNRDRLMCHHCGYQTRLPLNCPQCAAEQSFIACGPGVERIEEEFCAAFPQARVALASSDTLTDPSDMQAAIGAFAKGELDVMIGTQIVAKGLHFPQLTLAGVIDADLGGFGGDPRASERCFQLLHQVSGRAGRAEKPGLVLIQTRNPEDPIMRALASGDRDAFLDQEADLRERSGTPPFGRLAALLLSGKDGEAVRRTSHALASVAPKAKGVKVWGPAPAFYQVLRGRTRERLLVQTERNIDIQAYLREWLALEKIPSSVRFAIDVDPMSFF